MLADEIGKPINLPSVKTAREEFESLGGWDEKKKTMSLSHPSNANKVEGDDAIISSWRNLLDKGSLQDGEENLAGTARKSMIIISKSRARALNVETGDHVRVSNNYGAITLPCQIGDIDEASVWLPRNSLNSQLIRNLGVVSNSVVKVAKA